MADRVLVIGNGAREHALAYKLLKSSRLSAPSNRQVFVLGGNAGIRQDFECIEPEDQSVRSIVKEAKRIKPHLTVIGPESYLASGLVDALDQENIKSFGPSQAASKLEGEKSFMKEICLDANVRTAPFNTFSDFKEALAFVEGQKEKPLVIKVDGLCNGKGVSIVKDLLEAKRTLSGLFLEDGFKSLGVKENKIIIEEYLVGGEVSVFGLTDGSDVALFCPMQDHKRLLDADKGPNTGGMGAVGPLGRDRDGRARFLDSVKDKFFLPTLKGMRDRGHPFRGLLYAGLMLTEKGPFLLEYNVRFGDPETQALLFGTECDIYPLLLGIAHGHGIDLARAQAELLEMEPTISIVLASSGYPFGSSERMPITMPKNTTKNTATFFASTTWVEGAGLHAGHGRVASLVASGQTVDEARALGYGLLSGFHFSGMQYRKDIGASLTTLNDW